MVQARIHQYENDVPRPKWMAHVVLATRDKERLVDWYRTVFAAKTFIDEGPFTFLSFDREHHRFAIAEIPNAVPPDGEVRVGLIHFSFSYGAYALGELLATWERLKEAGIEPREAINHGTTCSLYYIDPDANEVELMAENFAEDEEANEWFSKGFFDKNPFGKFFDPAQLLARLRAGESARDLQYPARTDADWPEMSEVAPKSLAQRRLAILRQIELNGWLDLPKSTDATVQTTNEDVTGIVRTLKDRFATTTNEFKHCVVFDFGEDGCVTVDGKNPPVSIQQSDAGSFDVRVIIAPTDFRALLDGKTEAMDLMMKAKIKIKGDIKIMLALRGVLRPQGNLVNA